MWANRGGVGNVRIPIMIPIKGRRFIVLGSTLSTPRTLFQDPVVAQQNC